MNRREKILYLFSLGIIWAAVLLMMALTLINLQGLAASQPQQVCLDAGYSSKIEVESVWFCARIRGGNLQTVPYLSVLKSGK